MPIGTLALLTVALIANFAETYALTTYKRAVRGSHVRYLWRTRYVLLACLVAVVSIVIAIIDVAQGDLGFAALWLAIAAMRVVMLVLNRDKDDDDWFKRAGRRLRAGIRRLAARLTPQPGAVAPVPA